MLWEAMIGYHRTLKRVLEESLGRPDFHEKSCPLDLKGKPRPNKFAVAKVVRQQAPKDWILAPLRDYLIGDATAMLMSHLSKEFKAKNQSNPPTVSKLEGLSEEEYQQAYSEFADTIEFPLKPQHEEKIEKARELGEVNVAARLAKIYENWAASRAAGEILRRVEGATPRPIEFTHAEFGRGCLLARRGNDYYALIRLFSPKYRHWKQNVLLADFYDWRTREPIGGKKYPGVILPLELGREHHEQEFLEYGKPQSAKLVAKLKEDGTREFYVHVAFEFNPTPLEVKTFLGIDRGAAKLGSATLIDMEGHALQRGIDLEGSAFSAEMARIRSRVAKIQKRGIQHSRVFRLRGKKADALIGEYANKIVATAAENQSQIVIEKIKGVTMGRFLTQSQFTKLQSALTYKAERMGLPAPVEVPAAYTSQTCARCGHKAPENRPKKDASGKSVQDVFLCVVCGYAANADNNAGEIIALRGLHQVQSGGKFMKFEVFQLWLKDLVGLEAGRATSATGG